METKDIPTNAKRLRNAARACAISLQIRVFQKWYKNQRLQGSFARLNRHFLTWRSSTTGIYGNFAACSSPSIIAVSSVLSVHFHVFSMGRINLNCRRKQFLVKILAVKRVDAKRVISSTDIARTARKWDSKLFRSAHRVWDSFFVRFF